MKRSYTACTLITEGIDDAVGEKMFHSFVKYWPPNITLYVYYYGRQEPKFNHSRIVFLDLEEECVEFKLFRKRNKNNYLGFWFNQISSKLLNDPKTKAMIYFLFDTLESAAKSYTIIDANLTIESDVMIWVEYGMKTIKKIPVSLFNKILPQQVYGTYIGSHSLVSTNFFMFDQRNPQHEKFMEKWKSFFDSNRIFYEKFPCLNDLFFRLKEWGKKECGLKFINLVPKSKRDKELKDLFDEVLLKNFLKPQ